MRLAVVRHWVKAFRADGTCHVGGWNRGHHGAGRANVEPVFMAGPGPDVPLLEGEDEVRLGRDRYRDLVLAAMPGSRSEIAAATSMSRGSAGKWIDQLHDEGKCHIGAWKRPEKGPRMPVYFAGEGKDKSCTLKVFTEAEKSKRFRKKARADGRWEERNAVLRARYAADAAPRRRDPIMDALFGRRPTASREPHDGDSSELCPQ